MEMVRHKPKTIYNLDSNEKYSEARIVGGNPIGLIDFNSTPHLWAVEIYKAMHGRRWVPEQVAVIQDRSKYKAATGAPKRTYDLVLAQLSGNDAFQTNQLMDGINRYITSGVVNCALATQAMEESIHSRSYSVMILDVTEDRDYVMYLHQHDKELYLKDKAVGEMYSRLYDKDDPTTNDLLLCFVANLLLEGMIFFGGFAAMFALEEYFPKSSEMIAEINHAA